MSGVAARADAHGEAAWLLTESLLHALVAQTTLSLATAGDIVRTALDVQLELADARGDDPATAARSGQLLTTLAASPAIDTPRVDDTSP